VSLIDLIKRRRQVIDWECEGINLALYLINQFQERTFAFKGLKRKYVGLSSDELLKKLQDELDSMLILYRYTTKAKKYVDESDIPQAEIRLVGKASTMGRFNPLDIKLDIKTEKTDRRIILCG